MCLVLWIRILKETNLLELQLKMSDSDQVSKTEFYVPIIINVIII
jgi:hypothetical protein